LGAYTPERSRNNKCNDGGHFSGVIKESYRKGRNFSKWRIPNHENIRRFDKKIEKVAPPDALAVWCNVEANFFISWKLGKKVSTPGARFNNRVPGFPIRKLFGHSVNALFGNLSLRVKLVQALPPDGFRRHILNKHSKHAKIYF
jgi:hypothetical protein